MEYQYLLTHRPSDGVEVLTLSAPETLNALNRAMLEELGHYIAHMDPAVKVLIITGKGKAFVAGADISQMHHFTEQQAYDFSVLGAGVFNGIEQLPIPVIAAINGFALGGGCELALACDIRIASEKARFGQPEVKLGIIPGFSGTYRLPKIVGQGMAKEMIYSGRVYDAEDALRMGLVSSVVTAEALLQTAEELALNIAVNAPIALKKAKESINANYDLTASEAIVLENRLFAQCFTSEDQQEGMEAFLGKRKPEFKNK